MTGTEQLSLTDVAQRLGVHYMTVYRYVRTGRLAAQRGGTQWVVLESELSRFDVERHAIALAAPDGSVNDPVARLAERLLHGDENGAWAIAQDSLVGGASPTEMYQELFAPAMRTIGERWTRGEVTVAEEHVASGVMTRLVGRSGPLFRSRGTRFGTVVVGSPAGEMHALATAFAADILRASRYDVVDLGVNVPTDAFVQCVRDTNRLVAIAISITTPLSRPSAGDLMDALRRANLGVPIYLGGAGADAASAHQLGASHWAPDVREITSALKNSYAANAATASAHERLA